MKKAIILPIYLKLNKPEELPKSGVLALARWAVESLGILNDQNFILILLVCFDFSEGEVEGTLLEMNKFGGNSKGKFQKDTKTLLGLAPPW
jgi:hypothetical protein